MALNMDSSSYVGDDGNLDFYRYWFNFKLSNTDKSNVWTLQSVQVLIYYGDSIVRDFSFSLGNYALKPSNSVWASSLIADGVRFVDLNGLSELYSDRSYWVQFRVWRRNSSGNTDYKNFSGDHLNFKPKIRPTQPYVRVDSSGTWDHLHTVVAIDCNGTVDKTADFTPRMSEIPTAWSKTYEVRVINTKNGWSKYATKSFTYSIPSYSPSITAGTVSKYNSTNSLYTLSNPCKGLTGVQYSGSTIGNLNGANISSLTVTPWSGASATAASSGKALTWSLCPDAGEQTLTVKVTDSRGVTATKTIQYDTYKYAAPSVAAVLGRATSKTATSASEDGKYLLASADVNVPGITDASGAVKQTGSDKATVEWEIVKTYDPTATDTNKGVWETKTLTEGGMSTSLRRKNVTATGFDQTGGEIPEASEADYRLTVTVTDDIGNASSPGISSISATIPMMDFGANGNSIGIHTVANPSATERELLLGCKVDSNSPINASKLMQGGYAVYNLGSLEEIPSGANLNNYITPGKYVIGSGSVASVSNVPTTQGVTCVLVVEVVTSRILMQRFIMPTTGDGSGLSYARRRVESNWEGWNCTNGTDSVIAEGASGNWVYRKWASGIAECWGSLPVFASTFNSYYGAWYLAFKSPLPSGLFKSRPYCVMTPYETSGGLYTLSLNGDSNASQVGAYVWTHVQGETNKQFYMQTYCRGNWK